MNLHTKNTGPKKNVKQLCPVFRIRIYSIRIRIRIRHFRLNTDPDPDPIRIQGFYDQNLPITRPPKRKSKLQRKPSALKEKFQHFKTWKFFIFSIFVGHFAPLDPNLLIWLNSDPIRIRNTSFFSGKIAGCINRMLFSCIPPPISGCEYDSPLIENVPTV